jgi:hypothetical protein
MGRIVDLFAEVAAASEEGPDGLALPQDERERLRSEWSEEDLVDMLALVKDSFYQTELVDAADSLSSRLLEWLGALGSETVFKRTAAGGTKLTLEAVSQLARRVERLEEALELYRDGAPPDRKGFDALLQRLVEDGLEREKEPGPAAGEE